MSWLTNFFNIHWLFWKNWTDGFTSNKPNIEQYLRLFYTQNSLMTVYQNTPIITNQGVINSNTYAFDHVAPKTSSITVETSWLIQLIAWLLMVGKVIKHSFIYKTTMNNNIFCNKIKHIRLQSQEQSFFW